MTNPSPEAMARLRRLPEMWRKEAKADRLAAVLLAAERATRHQADAVEDLAARSEKHAAELESLVRTLPPATAEPTCTCGNNFANPKPYCAKHDTPAPPSGTPTLEQLRDDWRILRARKWDWHDQNLIVRPFVDELVARLSAAPAEETTKNKDDHTRGDGPVTLPTVRATASENGR